MDVLGRQPVMHDQRAAADRLGHMAVHLAMRVHRADDVTAAMRAQQHAVLRAALRHRPQRRHAAGVGLDVIDAARLAGDVAPVLEHAPHLVERHVRVGLQRRHPVLVEPFSCSLCLLAIAFPPR